MQLGADVLDLDELKGALPRHRNLEWVVDGTARRVRTKDDSLSRWGVTYVAGLVAIAITLRVVVRHDGERRTVKTVSTEGVFNQGIYVVFVTSKDEAK